MGNKIEIDSRQDNTPGTPKKMSSAEQQNYLSNKSKSAQKDGLYAEDRYFENYDSKNKKTDLFLFNLKIVILLESDLIAIQKIENFM